MYVHVPPATACQRVAQGPPSGQQRQPSDDEDDKRDVEEAEAEAQA